MAIPELLRTMGVAPEALLAEAGLDLKLFQDGDSTISYAARGRLLGLCAARTRCGHFGLLVGQRAGLSSLGLVGFLVQHSPDVGTALRSLVRYLHLHVRGAVPTLAVQGDSASVGYAIYQPGLEATDQTGDGAIATAVNILRELCGPDFEASEVLLAHAQPGDIRPFRRFFRAPLRFRAEQYAVVFPSRWLGRRLPAAEPELRRMLQKQIEELEATHRLDFPEQVRRVLRSALLTGMADEDKIAALFAIHTRTLHRRLRAFETRFSKLLDESRYQYACQMLQDDRMAAGQIAAALGYSEPSAFTRAFRRWSGTTPSAWRTRAGAGGRRRG